MWTGAPKAPPHEVEDSGTPTLDSTRLAYCGLDWVDEDALRLVPTLRGLTKLQTLDLSHNMLSSATSAALVEYLGHNTSLTALLLNNNEFGDVCVKGIATALRLNRHTKLTMLDLHGQRPWHLRPKDAADPGPPISRVAAAALAATVLGRRSLLHFSLNLEGAWLSLGQLQGVGYLETLDLSCSRLGVPSLVVIAKCLESNGWLKSLSLRQNRIDAEGAKVLGDALVANRKLMKLDLALNELGAAGALEIGNALSLNRAISRLDLSRNAIGARGALALAARLKSIRALTEVDLTLNGFGAEGWCALFDTLRGSFYDIAAAAAAAAVSANALALAAGTVAPSRIATWGLYNQGLTPVVAASLAGHVATSGSVTRLDLGRNKLGPEGGRALGRAVRASRSLRHLDLSHNQLGAEGARAVAEGLQASASLTLLDLDGNRIGAEGAGAVAEALLPTSALTALSLASNELCDVDIFGKVDQIARAHTASCAHAACTPWHTARTSHVHVLFWPQGLRNVKGVVALTAAVRSSISLKSLTIKQNSLGSTGAQLMGEALAANRSLTTVSLALCQLCGRDAWGCGAYDSQGVAAIATAIRISGSELGCLTSLDLAANDLDEHATASVNHACHSLKPGSFKLEL